MLARNDPSSLSARLIVAICPTQRQCLCLKHIFLRLGRLEGGSPWRHGRQWPQAASPRKRLAKHPFISEAPDTCLSVPLFCTYLFLSSSLRKMSKNAEQALTSVAVMMAVRRPSWCIAVFSWSFVSILCYFVYFFTILSWGTYTYQNWHVGCHPGIWPKINSGHKIRYRIKAEVVIFLLRYWSGVESTDHPRINGRRLSKLESLSDVDRRSRVSS